MVAHRPQWNLLLWKQQEDKDHMNSNSNVSCTFPNSSWRVEPHLTLFHWPITTCCGQGGIVSHCFAGGVTSGGTLTNNLVVEVVDVQQSIVWSLPNLIFEWPRSCSIVSLSDCFLVLGGDYLVDSVKSLVLTVSRKHECCSKLMKFLITIEFLG